MVYYEQIITRYKLLHSIMNNNYYRYQLLLFLLLQFGCHLSLALRLSMRTYFGFGKFLSSSRPSRRFSIGKYSPHFTVNQSVVICMEMSWSYSSIGGNMSQNQEQREDVVTSRCNGCQFIVFVHTCSSSLSFNKSEQIILPFILSRS